MRNVPKKYAELKKQFSNHLLAFKIGDFYEFYHDDAKIAAQTLGIVLSRTSKEPTAPYMAGFPYHQLHAYTSKLTAEGHTVTLLNANGEEI